MHPTRKTRNITGSFNKYLQAILPSVKFNFGEAEFETAPLNRWVQVDYISRTLSVKMDLICQLSFYAKDDRFGTKAEDLCDQVLDQLYNDPGDNNQKSIPMQDWFDVSKPVVGGIWIRPRQVNKPVVDQYGVTNLVVTLELKISRV